MRTASETGVKHEYVVEHTPLSKPKSVQKKSRGSRTGRWKSRKIRSMLNPATSQLTRRAVSKEKKKQFEEFTVKELKDIVEGETEMT